MWPYSDRELDWLNAPRPGDKVPALGDPDLIAFHVARGRQLRAEALSRMVRAGLRALRRRLVRSPASRETACRPDELAPAPR